MTPRQTQVAIAIRDYRHANGYAPTMQELADALAVSKVTIHGHVDELERQGVLRRDRFRARSLELLDASGLPPRERTTVLKFRGVIS